MTRRTAEERHRIERDVSTELMDVLVALHHPTRRWLAELLWIEGPATVGRLAARTGLAVGSVSHHLKPLHQQGFIEPAPELARDTRESWWRLKPRSMTWSVEDFDEGTLGRRVAQTAEAENLRFQVRAMQEWLRRAPDETAGWRTAANSVDTYVPATEAQVRDFAGRLSRLVREWSDECMADAAERPGVERRPVRAIARVFPSEPVRP